jgi:hypothetical protein
MTADVQQVAEQLRADYASPDPDREPAMASLFAATVELKHVPPAPTDGPLPGAMLRDVAIAETQAANRAFTEVTRDNVQVTVNGSSIRLQSTTKGTLVNGESVSIDTDVVVEIQDGRIVAMEARMSEEDGKRWRQALEAGGFEAPAR